MKYNLFKFHTADISVPVFHQSVFAFVSLALTSLVELENESEVVEQINVFPLFEIGRQNLAGFFSMRQSQRVFDQSLINIPTIGGWVVELSHHIFVLCDNCLVPSHPGKRDPFHCPAIFIRTLDFESLCRIISHDHHHVADRTIHHVLLNHHVVARCRSILN